MAERTLWVIRHAEAAPTPPGLTDHDRPLTDRGVAQARRIGRLIASGPRPEPHLVLTSDALRARQTWLAAAEEGAIVAAVHARRVLYGADRDEIAELIRALPDEAAVCAIVGHAPELPGLALSVSDARPAGEGRLPGWPPACVGVLEADGSWSDFPDGARLVQLTPVGSPEDETR